MNKAITINLNGRAFQADENAYQLLQDYLRQATEKLASDPDKSEIIADLEQALADKLEKCIGAGKNVVTEAEAKTVISEMGPVEESSTSSSEADSGQAHAAASDAGAQNNTGVKKLYRVREGSMIFGVCTGLAAYFDISVSLVRVIFIILALTTHGLWILIYFLMMLVIPTAETSAEQAAAFGAPFTAQEFVNRARAEYQKMGASGQWQQNAHEWKRKMHEEKRRMRREMRNWQWSYRYQYRPRSPLVGVLVAALSVIWVWGLVMLSQHGIVFGIAIPASMPLWIALLVWSLIYIFISVMVRGSSWQRYTVDQKGNTHYHHHGGPLQGLAWLALIVVVGWLVYHFLPQTHPTFLQAQQVWLRFWHKIQ